MCVCLSVWSIHAPETQEYPRKSKDEPKHTRFCEHTNFKQYPADESARKITHEEVEPVVQAAKEQPFSQNDSRPPANGLLEHEARCSQNSLPATVYQTARLMFRDKVPKQ